jgi:hypothetical protein
MLASEIGGLPWVVVDSPKGLFKSVDRGSQRVAQVGRLRPTCVPKAEEVLLPEKLPCEFLRITDGILQESQRGQRPPVASPPR